MAKHADVYTSSGRDILPWAVRDELHADAMRRCKVYNILPVLAALFGFTFRSLLAVARISQSLLRSYILADVEVSRNKRTGAFRPIFPTVVAIFSIAAA